jgi:hypothetical protein
MTGIYICDCLCNKYQNIVPLSEDDWSPIMALAGAPVAWKWKPIRVRVLREKKRDWRRPVSDTPSIGLAIPVLSEHAVGCLRHLLAPHGEFLPLACDEGVYFLYNVTTVLDALDIDHSDVIFFDDESSRIMRIKTYAFIPDVVRGVDAFKLLDREKSDVFLSERVKLAAESCGLKGFDFQLVWTFPEG